MREAIPGIQNQHGFRMLEGSPGDEPSSSCGMQRRHAGLAGVALSICIPIGGAHAEVETSKSAWHESSAYLAISCCMLSMFIALQLSGKSD